MMQNASKTDPEYAESYGQILLHLRMIFDSGPFGRHHFSGDFSEGFPMKILCHMHSTLKSKTIFGGDP